MAEARRPVPARLHRRGQWVKKELPQRWTLGYKGLTLNIKPMNFKHTGVFPEQAANWDFAMERIRSAGRPIQVLNLFAYTGAASVACAAAEPPCATWTRPRHGELGAGERGLFRHV